MTTSSQVIATGLAPELKLKNAIKEQMAEITASYQGERGELIPILQKVQGRFGYLPVEAMVEVAKFLHMPESDVYGVATFYAQFKLTPIGRNTIKVCRGTACHVRGVGRILSELERRLGTEPGETTPDQEYTLETVACFGSCALAPVVVLNNTVYGRVTIEKAEQILGKKSKDKKAGT